MSGILQVSGATLSQFALGFILSVVANTAVVSADEVDQFEGAIWQFTLTPKSRGLETLKGQYRVSDHLFYQKSKPKIREFDKVVGDNHPSGRKTKSVFKDLRAFDKKRNLHSGIKGTAHLEMEQFGEWSGRFIDSEGRHWDFQCSRMQE